MQLPGLQIPFSRNKLGKLFLDEKVRLRRPVRQAPHAKIFKILDLFLLISWYFFSYLARVGGVPPAPPPRYATVETDVKAKGICSGVTKTGNKNCVGEVLKVLST